MAGVAEAIADLASDGLEEATNGAGVDEAAEANGRRRAAHDLATGFGGGGAGTGATGAAGLSTTGVAAAMMGEAGDDTAAVAAGADVKGMIFEAGFKWTAGVEADDEVGAALAADESFASAGRSLAADVAFSAPIRKASLAFEPGVVVDADAVAAEPSSARLSSSLLFRLVGSRARSSAVIAGALPFLLLLKLTDAPDPTGIAPDGSVQSRTPRQNFSGMPPPTALTRG